jgi:hypothetical protein
MLCAIWTGGADVVLAAGVLIAGAPALGCDDSPCIILAGGVEGCGCAVVACAEGMIAGTVKVLAAATEGTAATAMRSAIFRMFEVSIIAPVPS